MYPPYLLDELARIYAEAALESLLVETAVPSVHHALCHPRSADGTDLTVIDSAPPVADEAKDDNISQ